MRIHALPSVAFHRLRLMSLIVLSSIGGCVTTQPPAAPNPPPPKPPEVNETRLQESLHCMDQLLISNGVRDIVVLTEDLADNTGMVKVGTREMLFSAISDMTRRSGAIRSIGYGKDAANIQTWLEKFGAKNNVYNFQPAYSVRGGITQWDQLGTVSAGKNVQLGVVGGGRQSSSSVALIGTDFNIMSTKTFEVLPGVNSRNSVKLEKSGEGSSFVLGFGGQQNSQNQPMQGNTQSQQNQQGQGGQGGGLQGAVANNSFGVNFYVGVVEQQGQGGGIRTLVELASVELFGKLLRVPYWQCLGVSSAHPKVQREIADWYFTLTNEGKLIPYMQNQLRIMGKYNGPVNGSQSREFYQALKEVATTNKLPAPQTVDEKLFSLILNMPNKNILIPKEPIVFTDAERRFSERQPVAGLGKPKGGFDRLRVSFVSPQNRKPTPDGSPLELSIRFDGVEETTKNGSVVLKKNVDTAIQAYVYCYAVSDGGNTTTRFFPNESMPVPIVRVGEVLRLTGEQGLPIKVGVGVESIFCHASDTDPSMNPGKSFVGRDFEERQRPVREIRVAVGATSVDFYGDASWTIRRK